LFAEVFDGGDNFLLVTYLGYYKHGITNTLGVSCSWNLLRGKNLLSSISYLNFLFVENMKEPDDQDTDGGKSDKSKSDGRSSSKCK
jgi:hypothetical protein